MFRTHTCGELRIDDFEKEVTLAGWIQTIRSPGIGKCCYQLPHIGSNPQIARLPEYF